MALRLDKPGRKVEYVLIADRESAEPTVFVLRPLTWEEMADVNALAPFAPEQAMLIAAIGAQAKAEGRELNEDEMRRMGEVVPFDMEYVTKTTRQSARAVRLGLVEIRRLFDQEGRPQEMSAADFARHAPAEILREIGQEVMRISKHDGDLIKK